MNEYEVRVTRLALEQMKEIVHYISNDLMAPDAADNLLDKMKAEITKLSSFPKKHAVIDEEPWRQLKQPHFSDFSICSLLLKQQS